MKIDYLLFAQDRRENPEGGEDIIGVYHLLRAPHFPVIFGGLKLFVSGRMFCEDIGVDFRIQIAILDEDNKAFPTRIDEVITGPECQPGRFKVLRFYFEIKAIDIPNPGYYRAVITANGREIAETPLKIMYVAGKEPGPQTPSYKETHRRDSTPEENG